MTDAGGGRVREADKSWRHVAQRATWIAGGGSASRSWRCDLSFLWGGGWVAPGTTPERGSRTSVPTGSTPPPSRPRGVRSVCWARSQATQWAPRRRPQGLGSGCTQKGPRAEPPHSDWACGARAAHPAGQSGSPHSTRAGPSPSAPCVTGRTLPGLVAVCFAPALRRVMETPGIDPLGQNFHYVRRGRGGGTAGGHSGRTNSRGRQVGPQRPPWPSPVLLRKRVCGHGDSTLQSWGKRQS